MASNFDVMDILRRELDLSDVKTVLDLGCGSFYNSPYDYKTTDILLNIFGDKEITGIDIYKPNIEWRTAYGPKGNYILMDIIDFDFKEKFDVVICHAVLEHLTQEQHDTILNRIEDNFTKYAILGGPINYSDNSHHVNETGNPYEEHLISLNPDIYEGMGYRIFKIPPDNFVAIKER
jgi:trans-aconitate methyltransferase